MCQEILKSSYRQVKNMLAMVNIAAYKAFSRRGEGAELGAGTGGVVELSDLTITLNFCLNEQWGTTGQIKYLEPAVSRGIL